MNDSVFVARASDIVAGVSSRWLVSFSFVGLRRTVSKEEGIQFVAHRGHAHDKPLCERIFLKKMKMIPSPIARGWPYSPWLAE